ncbi:MAG TPA: restriction endonuclease [Anaerolineales bacterium]|nr:restriction endonuclease [Anaerolineales bacterium]
MSDLQNHRVGEMIRGVIELLWSKPYGLTGREVISRLPEVVELTEYEIGLSPSSLYPRYGRVVRLATLPMVEIGWLVKTDKGLWFITENGREACRRYSRPQDLVTESLRLVKDKRDLLPDILVSLELIQEKVWEDIVKYIQAKNAVDLRQLMAFLLEGMQYYVVWMAPPEKKHGLVDLIASVEPVGGSSKRIIVQIKHTGQQVTGEGVKSFLASLGDNDFGLMFSTGGYTPDVKELLGSKDYIKINAMDLEKFYGVWIRHYDSLSTEAHKLLPLKKIFVLNPEN